MKINFPDGKKNVIGSNVRKARRRLKPPLNQRELAEKLQLAGCDIDRLTISRIERGERLVTDFEVRALKEVLGVSFEDLYKNTNN
ncbi:helix-turn-helix domain-containing protein [Harryflintia acetispora]|uniref:helix-turn-helix domain-containing protein n=1 Tax=Harryflintia acetispora TaxID=1849041 RepID=UPI001052DCC2|nr:helix-turn-helix transcriptional regulator [Harryflintia acetispora]